MIIEVVNTKNWRALRMGKEGHWLSHLMFADDLLLLEEAKECQMECVMNILGKFNDMSGEEVNKEKTCIIFSKNVSRCIRNKILHMANFHETYDMGKYLGVTEEASSFMNFCILLECKIGLYTYKTNFSYSTNNDK